MSCSTHIYTVVVKSLHIPCRLCKIFLFYQNKSNHKNVMFSILLKTNCFTPDIAEKKKKIFRWTNALLEDA